MITSIEIKNVNSIGFTKLSFKKAGYKYLNEYILKDEVANPIAVYGSNGSGKSSLITAFFYLLRFLINEPDNIFGFMPNFSEMENFDEKEFGMKINFKLSNKNYSYSIFQNKNEISKEELTINDKSILIRNFKSYIYNEDKYEIESKFFPALRDIVTKSKASEDVSSAFEFLSNIAFVSAIRNEYSVKSFKNRSQWDVMVEKSSEVKELLKTYKQFPSYDIFSKQNATPQNDYFFHLDTPNNKLNLPLTLMSNGMKNQSFLLSILLSLPQNGVLIIDEIDQALHPLTIQDFITVVLEKNIQLIFSGHNTNIFTQLRPDNIVFANWEAGYSTYKRLSDIYPNIREINNIEKMYLSSTFDDLIGSDTK